MRSRTRALALAGSLLVLVAGGLTACELPPPRFVVTTTVDGHDATPGDAVCEVTTGVGDCSFRAAVEEANAAGGARIRAEPGVYDIDGALGPVTATGVVTLEAVFGEIILDHEPATAQFGHRVLEVGDGGQLSATRLVVSGETVVHGTLALRQSRLHLLTLATPLVTLRVEPGGKVFVENSLITSVMASSVVNAGLLHARHTSFRMEGGPDIGPRATLVTAGDGETILASSMVVSDPIHRFPRGAACGGAAPTSSGYNAAHDATCVFTAVGDVLVPIGSWEPTIVAPIGTSPALDAIPPGTNGCGTEVVIDRIGAPRPTDSNLDGAPACEIGAREV
jgi:CSLREA domain-containing protein